MNKTNKCRLRTLLDLSVGEVGVIKSIKGCKDIKDRLYGLGLIEGIEIILIKDTPFNSPRVYKYLNTVIAIRRGVAKKIEVTT